MTLDDRFKLLKKHFQSRN